MHSVESLAEEPTDYKLAEKEIFKLQHILKKIDKLVLEVLIGSELLICNL